jgi:DNA-binding YbaB/EbfC family protein
MNMAYGGKTGYTGGMGNVNKMMKQVQKMQADMDQLQEQLADVLVESTAGGGAVRVVMNCKQEVKELRLDPEILAPDDAEMIQDLLIAALNDASKKSRERSNEEMTKITGNIKLPGLF